ncbi:hypothetical protein AWZ03_013682 [Drosophila navojoa]|uniref:Uncharacterized protein n=1 Tax=Drosophila navojoa TaxID=7232 RepID=A0A484AWA5_DRONA|nr:hypothetical protein AWZ03_013682 [Drosophila navojoa]
MCATSAWNAAATKSASVSASASQSQPQPQSVSVSNLAAAPCSATAPSLAHCGNVGAIFMFLRDLLGEGVNRGSRPSPLGQVRPIEAQQSSKQQQQQQQFVIA